MRIKRLATTIILAATMLSSAACGQVSHTTQQSDLETATAVLTETSIPTIAEGQPWTLTIVHSNDTMGQMVPSG